MTEIKDQMEEKLDKMMKKIDFITDTMVELARQFKRFRQEFMVLTIQMSNVTDRLEKVEVAVFGVN